ncbi:hypothetical protein FPQ18DRAFT_306373 [Pyronema domesticum]|uniref:Uncharacterized protein n=1 Tax=Pyronema omphalodes (strain CBS 100304) TaxID=1076935 RepID=U4LAI9_PYROM|nr:hypothetical protein FPQ18DRAFT_306373 [Pyronema domesticum]CCX07174.1 Protein of unknown function [Pyronema omphalodes CBS 100304]
MSGYNEYLHGSDYGRPTHRLSGIPQEGNRYDRIMDWQDGVQDGPAAVRSMAGTRIPPNSLPNLRSIPPGSRNSGSIRSHPHSLMPPGSRSGDSMYSGSTVRGSDYGGSTAYGESSYGGSSAMGRSDYGSRVDNLRRPSGAMSNSQGGRGELRSGPAGWIYAEDTRQPYGLNVRTVQAARRTPYEISFSTTDYLSGTAEDSDRYLAARRAEGFNDWYEDQLNFWAGSGRR